jgi:cell division protein FtsB
MDEIINEQQEPNLENSTEKKNKNILLIVKFVIVGFVAALVIVFGENSVLRSCKETAKANKLNKEKEEYEQKINDTKAEINKFKEDKSRLEHQAREEYLMRKENEDVFIIEN